MVKYRSEGTEIKAIDEKIAIIHKLSQYDPLFLMIREKFQAEVTHHLTSLKLKKEKTISEVLKEEDPDIETMRQAYLSYGKELAVTQFIFDILPQKLSIKNILLLAEILVGETSFRQKEIFITNVSGNRQSTPQPSSIAPEMQKLVGWYNEAIKSKEHPVAVASVLHHKLTVIQPFGDWNGRIARLLLNISLMQLGYLPVLIAADERLSYYEKLEKADNGSIEPLITFIAQLELKALDSFMLSPGYLSIKAKYEMQKQIETLGDTEKCIVLTEDSATGNLMGILLESSGFKMQETNIISYEGCSKISSANLFSIFVKEKMPNVKILVHRDRDYLTDAEIDAQRETFSRIGVYFFVTKGTDMESYFLNYQHISFCHPEISETVSARLVNEAMEEVFPKSVDYLRKKEFGGSKPESFSHLNQAIEVIVRNSLRRFTHGKTALRILENKIQDVVRRKSQLEQPSHFLSVKQLRKISDSIWGNQEII